jgi:DNA end-binding protein Ku
MARALWSGSISFGLINIPVQLMPGERRTDLRFHLMDVRNKARVRYERINAETGEEVPWKDIVKAFEFRKGDYVVLEKEDLRAAAPQSSESVDLERFVPLDAVPVEYFERPYYLVPPKKAEKSYVLLRETLRDLKKAGLARVVIRTREYLALLLPRGAALMLLLLRYPQELIPDADYSFPGSLSSYRLGKRELEMARQLVRSMEGPWKPAEYRDEFRARLHKVIEERMKQKGARIEKSPAPEAGEPSGKVIDLMSLLKKSLENKKGAKRAVPARAGRRPRAAERKRA